MQLELNASYVAEAGVGAAVERAPWHRLHRRLRKDRHHRSIEGFAFIEESIELSRRFRAHKIWLSVRYHGIGRFREAIRKDLRHAQLLASMIEAEPALELLAPVELSAVCFSLDACIVNHRTSEDDVAAVIDEVLTAAQQSA